MATEHQLQHGGGPEMKLNTKIFALSAALLTATTAIGWADNADVKIGMTPKFLKDDFQALMLNLSVAAFEAKGFTMVGAPDPNGDIAAQVDALQNLIAGGANVIVFAPIDAAGIVPGLLDRRWPGRRQGDRNRAGRQLQCRCSGCRGNGAPPAGKGLLGRQHLHRAGTAGRSDHAERP
jgi:hypothetical protein